MRQLRDVIYARPEYDEKSSEIWKTYYYTKFGEQIKFLEFVLSELHILDVIAFQKYMNAVRDELRNWQFWSGFCLMADKSTIDRFDGLSGFVISAGYEYFEKLKDNPSQITRNISDLSDANFPEILSVAKKVYTDKTRALMPIEESDFSLTGKPWVLEDFEPYKNHRDIWTCFPSLKSPEEVYKNAQSFRQ